MLVVLRFEVGAAEEAGFLAEARTALAVLAERPGWRSTRIGRATDDPTSWVVTTEWDSVGAYRRALSSYDVKVQAVPLLSRARDEPSAFEVLDARAWARTVSPGRAPGPRTRDVTGPGAQRIP